MSNAALNLDDDIDVSTPDCDSLDLVIRPRVKDLGDGFVVRRLLPFHKRRMVGPFIFFDHFGPVEYAPGTGFDVRPHPHIGLSTVTYLFEGAITHKDTVGSDLVIRPGAVNWMTAGGGIVHSERTPAPERAAGQRLHGIQTWVALPADLQDIPADFVHHPADSLPVFDLGGAKMQLIAGAGWGHNSPVEFPHPIWYLAGDAPGGAAFEIPADAAAERAVYVADGTVTVGSETLDTGAMGILQPECAAFVQAGAGAKFMLAGGAPYPERRLIDWNLVATDRGLIEAAKRDWQNSAENGWRNTRFTLPEGEQDYIPSPR
ncbi:MAG: pirin family protein [Pseudomonadota bacterium]